MIKSKENLPINAACAKQWRANPNHLPENCGCLARKAKELHQSFTNRLTWDKSQLEKECQCETSLKQRITYIDSYGNGWTYCEICQRKITSAGHHGVIKNRNNPKFWGLETKEKILCGNCLENKKGDMKPTKRAEFNRYRKTNRL